MPPKGKQGTKGQKQIVEENLSTLNFYRYIIFGVNGVVLLLQYFIFWENLSWTCTILTYLALAVSLGCYKFMASMAKATYSAEGQLLDGGIDLNMQSGMAEHAKDLILLTSIIEALTLISGYFWLFWLLAPGWAFYLLWVNILGPWFFAPPPEEDEKKTKKMERKMRRH